VFQVGGDPAGDALADPWEDAVAVGRPTAVFTERLIADTTAPTNLTSAVVRSNSRASHTGWVTDRYITAMPLIPVEARAVFRSHA